MAKTTVGIYIFEAFDIVCDQALQITFGDIILVDNVAKLLLFSLGEVFHTSGRLNLCRRKDALCVLWTDAIDIRQRDLHLFLRWDNYPRDSSHA